MAIKLSCAVVYLDLVRECAPSKTYGLMLRPNFALNSVFHPDPELEVVYRRKRMRQQLRDALEFMERSCGVVFNIAVKDKNAPFYAPVVIIPSVDVDWVSVDPESSAIVLLKYAGDTNWVIGREDLPSMLRKAMVAWMAGEAGSTLAYRMKKLIEEYDSNCSLRNLSMIIDMFYVQD
jgi:hypothetical protein